MYKVLIVDNNINELNTLSHIINWDEFGLTVAGLLTDSCQALDFLCENTADILITNVSLPQTSGIELLKQARVYNPDIKCIFYADSEDCGYAEQAIPLGIENFLIKPVASDILTETLSRTARVLQNTLIFNRPHPPMLGNQAFEQLMRNGEYQQCVCYVESLFCDAAIPANTTPNALKNRIVELTVYIMDILRNCHIQINQVIEDESNIYDTIIRFQNADELYVWMRGFLTASVEALKSRNSPSSPSITRAIAYIEENFAQDISLKTMAYELNINAAYLGQLIKAKTGQRFSVYLHKIRIENAKKMLLETTLPVSRISRQCGYSNDGYFYSIFKKYTGQTPSQFRKVKAK